MATTRTPAPVVAYVRSTTATLHVSVSTTRDRYTVLHTATLCGREITRDWTEVPLTAATDRTTVGHGPSFLVQPCSRCTGRMLRIVAVDHAAAVTDDAARDRAVAAARWDAIEAEGDARRAATAAPAWSDAVAAAYAADAPVRPATAADLTRTAAATVDVADRLVLGVEWVTRTDVDAPRTHARIADGRGGVTVCGHVIGRDWRAVGRIGNVCRGCIGYVHAAAVTMAQRSADTAAWRSGTRECLSYLTVRADEVVEGDDATVDGVIGTVEYVHTTEGEDSPGSVMVTVVLSDGSRWTDIIRPSAPVRVGRYSRRIDAAHAHALAMVRGWAHDAAGPDAAAVAALAEDTTTTVVVPWDDATTVHAHAVTRGLDSDSFHDHGVVTDGASGTHRTACGVDVYGVAGTATGGVADIACDACDAAGPVDVDAVRATLDAEDAAALAAELASYGTDWQEGTEDGGVADVEPSDYSGPWDDDVHGGGAYAGRVERTAVAAAYAVTATVERTTADGWTRTTEVPTFYLHAAVQGIVSTDHAERIARRMLAGIAGPDATVHVSVAVAELA